MDINKKYEKILNQFPEIATRERFYEYYVIKQYSFPMLRQEFGISFRSISFLIDYFKINKRSNSEARKIQIKEQNKRFKLKYGVDNPSQLEEIKQKKKNTLLKNYGVDNYFKIENFKLIQEESFFQKHGISIYDYRSEVNKKFYNTPEMKIEQSKKSILAWETIKNDPLLFEITKKRLSKNAKLFWENLSEIDRHNICEKISIAQKKIWDSLSDDEKNNKLKHLFNIKKSSIESRISKTLIENGITFESQYPLCKHFYDFRIGRTLVEVNGDYWHANPKIYKENDLMFNKIPAYKIWEKDEIKKKIAIDSGFLFVTLWECDIRKQTNEEILYNILGEI